MKKQQKTSLAKGKDDMSLLEQRIAELEEVRFGEPVPSSWLRQRNRKFAYHEAAHATARMFTGQSNSIKKVTIVPCAEYGGRVTSRSGPADIPLSLLPPPVRESHSRASLLILFAGPKAEYHVETFPNLSFKRSASLPRWLDDGFLEEDDNWQLEGSDFFRAKQIAEAIARPGYPAYRILRLAAQWTEEMLAIPEVWAATERLAVLLLEKGEVSVASEIMDVSTPISDMYLKSSKWRRRLLPKVSG